MAIYKHVVILGVDGAGAFFRDTPTPNMDKIFENGATSYDVLTSIPTISAECWGSLLLGVTPEVHRLTNGIVSSMPYDVNSPFPSVFRIVRAAYPDAELASFCCWNPINHGIIENNLGVHKDTAGDGELTEKILAYLDGHAPTLLFVQFDSIDGAGHTYGYGFPEHLAAITSADGWIGRIYGKYEEKGLLDDTLFIVTADHGGTPTRSHGGTTDAEKYVFLGVRGKTVEKGTIGDAGIRDLAAITAYALGVDLPETWTARVPSGVFTGVEAAERRIPVIPQAAHRTHANVPTPAGGAYLKDIPGIRAYLPFDGNNVDITGSYITENHGKLYHTDGYFGRGLVLDDGYVTLKNCTVGAKSFSIGAWVRFSGAASDPAIFGNKDWHSGKNPGFVLAQEGSAIHFNAGDGKSRMDFAAFLPLDYANGWVHILLAVDRVNGKVLVFCDFEKIAETEIPDELRDASFDGLDFNIGQDGTGTYGAKLSAAVDEFLLYAGVPSGTQLAMLRGYYGNTCLQ